jgi:hypothetical protein
MMISLDLPPRPPRRIPVWRLCLLMALVFLILWIGAPVLFAWVLA